jgi:hypothetical protein
MEMFYIKKHKVDPVEKKLAQVSKNIYIMSTGWKTSDNHNSFLAVDLLEDEDLVAL